MPNSDQNSSPEFSRELDFPMEEEDEELEEVEEEVEVEEEEEVEVDEEEKREGDEEDNGDVEFEEVEEEVVEEEEEAGDEYEDEAEDASKILESEGHGEYLELVSLTPEMSESNLASPDKEATGSDFVAHNASAKIPAVKTKEAPAVRSPGQDKHISEEKGCSNSLVDEKEITVSLEKKMSNEDPEHIKNSFFEAHGSQQCNLNSSGSIGSGKAAPSEVQNKGLAETDAVRNSPKIGKSDDILEKEVSRTLLATKLKMPEASSLSSMHTTHRRPRSASPGVTPENLSKRPAIVCVFYGRGWCIKGMSCPYLHQKEESKGLVEPVRKDVVDGTDSRGEAERLRIACSQERPNSSNTESPSKSQFHVQRALVRAYGEESHGSLRFHDDYNTNAGEEFHKVDILRVGGMLVRDDYKRPFGLGSQLDSMVEKQSASEIFLTRRYLHEEQLQEEMPKKEFLNDSPFSRGYSLTSSEVPEHRYYSGNSSTSSSLYLSNNNSVAHDRRTQDFAFRHHQSSFPLHGSLSSYSSSGSLCSTFNCSSQSNPASSSSAERFDIYKTFDLDKGYHSSRSASLPRSSSPYLSRHEAGTGLLRNTPRDLPAFIRQKMEAHENSWEPSVPFCPSFHYALSSLSSPGNQYDPLLDSIEPHNTGNISLQASERTINVNFSGHSAEGDPRLHGSQTTEYNMEKTLSFFSQPHEAIPKKCKPEHGLSRQTSLGVTPRDTAIDWGNTSVPKEEKFWGHDHLVESANVNGADVDGDLKFEGDKSRISKESKAMKFFRAALVDFVKELVKPSWREGHLSKDAHKMVVKKAVEKVLGSFQPHQIPNTTESINQYLSTSRPKLLKLVEGYIEKYAKSEATRVNMSEVA